jgi:hypothetical protein
VVECSQPKSEDSGFRIQGFNLGITFVRRVPRSSTRTVGECLHRFATSENAIF